MHNLSSDSCWSLQTTSLNGLKQSLSPNVTEHQIVKFLWQNIVCCYGLPHTIISDSKTNLASRQVARFCFQIQDHIVSPPPTIHKATARPRSVTALSETACAGALMKREANAWRNSPGYYGHIGPPSASQQVKLRSH